MIHVIKFERGMVIESELFHDPKNAGNFILKQAEDSGYKIKPGDLDAVLSGDILDEINSEINPNGYSIDVSAVEPYDDEDGNIIEGRIELKDYAV